ADACGGTMIRRVYSDLPKFKTLDFGEGLNILLADKSPKATEKHTRNRAGKSSLLDLLHFLLGSKAEKKSVFRSDALKDVMFGMEFDLGGSFTRAERVGARASQLSVAGDFTTWPVLPTPRESGHAISNENWKVTLAKLMFGLNEHDEPYAP